MPYKNTEEITNEKELPIATLEEIQEASQSKTTTIIDARPKPFYELGHIPNAINITPREIGSYENLPEGKPIIVYCFSPTCPDSQKVGEFLQKNNENIKIFKEGWELWEMMGLPTETTK